MQSQHLGDRGKRTGSQDYPQPHSKFKAILSYVRPPKKSNKKERKEEAKKERRKQKSSYFVGF